MVKALQKVVDNRLSMMSDLGFILISFKKCLDTAFQKHINNYDTKKDNIYC